jgi:hypothetical protein
LDSFGGEANVSVWTPLEIFSQRLKMLNVAKKLETGTIICNIRENLRFNVADLEKCHKK